MTDTAWTDAALDELRSDFGDAYRGRTVLVTGADGFMGSHLTDALVELGAKVHAFVRATSSGALNNIGHLRNRLKVHFADLTDKTSIDYLIRELKESADDRPYVFHLGAQAHVGESWHRPYETVMANTIGTLNLLQSIVDRGLEVEKFDTAGTSEEYGNVRDDFSDHHDFDDAGRADPARALADQPQVHLRDGEGRRGLPDHELLRRVRPPRRGDADVQQLRAAPEPALCDGHDHHAGARLTRRSSSASSIRCATSASAPTASAATSPSQRTERRATSTSTARARTSRWGTGSRSSSASARSTASGPPAARSSRPRARYRPGASEVMALRVGHEKLTRETGWMPKVSWEEGVLETIRWYAANERWIGRVDWLPTGQPASAAVSQVLVTGGGGFVGSHLVERLEQEGHDVFAARRSDYDLTSMDDTGRLFAAAAPELVFHLAAEVGGIGANRANPGRYWYANLMMGAHVLEQARLHETPKLVVAGTICAYPKLTPVPFHEDDLWNGYPEETNAPYGVAKKAILVGAQAYRDQYAYATSSCSR